MATNPSGGDPTVFNARASTAQPRLPPSSTARRSFTPGGSSRSLRQRRRPRNRLPPAAGNAADLTILDGDPASDVTAFACVLYTIRDGRIIYQRR